MAIPIPKKKKNKNYLTPLLVIMFLLAVVLIAWKVFLAKPATTSSSTVLRYQEIKINKEILKSPILKELQAFEEIKPIEEKVGRENPFSPY